MKLLEDADVFITNTRTKSLAKMGLDWESLHAKFPRLIMRHGLRYGKKCPEKDAAGFDVTCYMGRGGVFGTTVVLFFLAEMGDKTQLATVALAAKFPAEALWVISGTTLGMMIADAPAVFIGNKLAERLSMKLMRRIAAAVFAILAVAAWLGC